MNPMRKAFQFRLYPSNRQEKLLRQTLDECRWLYNQLLEDRQHSWQERKESLGVYDQHTAILRYKREREGLQQVHSQVLQNVAVRLDLAFKAFFRRVKAGENPGYPRFRGAP